MSVAVICMIENTPFLAGFHKLVSIIGMGFLLIGRGSG